MKKYMSVLRIKFLNGLQYRAAALAGLVTQFAWGGMLVLLYRAFYEADPTQFPMTMQQTASYIWMQQAFLSLMFSWQKDNELFDIISSGNIAYELVRPIGIYGMWFMRNVGMRVSRALLRCIPVLVFAALLPAPYGLVLALDWRLPLFLVSLVMAMCLVVAVGMLEYVATFWTISAQGVRIVAQAASELLSGQLIPIPFLPPVLQRIVKLLPFGYMQDVPLRIYSGSISGWDIAWQMGGQALWLVMMVLIGMALMRRATKRVIVQGG
ncbi:MAG: ABC transporter permease [Candidatus Fimadaptatus sp.]|jgi:ABC-2 type transport system permease protein